MQKTAKSMIEYESCQYRCDKCVVGFKKRGVFVNHLVSRHPETNLDSVPSLNQPVVVKTKMYMCLYCDKVSSICSLKLCSCKKTYGVVIDVQIDFCLIWFKVYKTNAKRKSHILKNHPDCQLPEKPTDKVT